MAQEPRRGCGYRKVGGIYLCGGADGLWSSCCKLPIELGICPTCHGGIKQSRTWQWIDPGPWLPGGCSLARSRCPAAYPGQMGERVGLLWVGTQFYPTAESFRAEAVKLGVSRRIKVVPRGFEMGKTWVLFAHPKAIYGMRPGIFLVFRPEALEKIITETMARDREAMQKLHDAGIEPIVVPDHDLDHQGSAYDEKPAQQELVL